MRAGILTDGAYDHSPALADPADRVVVSFTKPDPSRRAWPNSGGGDKSHRQLFLGDEKEFGAICFLIGVSIIPAFFLFALVFFYMALIG